MTSTTGQAPLAVLRSPETERRLRRLVHPRVATVLLPGGVVGIAALLYFWWPAGVVVGCVAGTVAVLAVGMVMQRAERAAPVAEDLAALLGTRERRPQAPVPVEAGSAVATSSVSTPVDATPIPSPQAEAAPAEVAALAAAPVETTPVETTAVEAPRIAATPAIPASATAIPVEAGPAKEGPAERAPVDEAPVEKGPVAESAEVDTDTGRLAVVRAAVDQHEAEEAALEPVRAVVAERDPDLRRLRAELGDDYDDFARAARLVVATQYASAARLQRELGLPWARARRLIDELETERFVGPATGSLPRQVMVSKDRLGELDRILS